MQDRQKRYRIRIAAIVTLKEALPAGRVYLFYTENLSASGALVKNAYDSGSSTLSVGDRVALRIQLPTLDDDVREIKSDATIVRKDSATVFALAFNFDHSSQKQLQSYIARFISEFPEAII